MRNRIIRWVFCMVAVCCVFLPAAAWAENPEKVVDKARLFSEEEASHLQEFCEDAIQATGMDVVIVTTDDTEGKTAQEYADDYFDYNGYGNCLLYTSYTALHEKQLRVLRSYDPIPAVCSQRGSNRRPIAVFRHQTAAARRRQGTGM